jgi:hypothetical protein
MYLEYPTASSVTRNMFLSGIPVANHQTPSFDERGRTRYLGKISRFKYPAMAPLPHITNPLHCNSEVE